MIRLSIALPSGEILKSVARPDDQQQQLENFFEDLYEKKVEYINIEDELSGDKVYISGEMFKQSVIKIQKV